jgi:hypothetical protein
MEADAAAPSKTTPDASAPEPGSPSPPPDIRVEGDAGTAAAEDPPAPPGVGLMHTAAQLDFVRAHKGQEPWLSAFTQLIDGNAEPALARAPNPMADFDVPGGYVDPDAHKAAKDRLRQDAFAAYALALGYQLAVRSTLRKRPSSSTHGPV